MSDVIYVENDNGLNVSINEMETEINPEGYIFVRNGEKEIEAYVQDIVKPDLALYSQNKQNDIENTLNTQVDAARVQLNNFTNSECQTYISQTCQDKKNEIAQFAEQSQNAYASFVEEKNLEVENIVAQANAAAESATSSKNAAASSATSSSNYSNNSKVWAEGSDSQVQALGGTHSAKGWANLVNDSVLVHKTGNETIAGDKTFTGNIIPSSVLFKSKTGGANQGFLYQNSSGNLYFGLRNSGNTEFMNNFSFAPDGSITVSIGNSATNKAFIVPNPATSDNSAKAATTNWVRQVLNDTTSSIQTQLNARLDTSLSNISTTGKQNILMWGIPNYSAGVAQNKDVDYTAERCGYLLELSNASARSDASKIIVNNVTVATIGLTGTAGGIMWSAAFVNKGDRYRFAGVNSTSRTFFPLRGA